MGAGLSSPSRCGSPPSGLMPRHRMGVGISLITAVFPSPRHSRRISGWEAGGPHCLSQRLILDMRNRDLLSLVAGLRGARGTEPPRAQGSCYTPLSLLGVSVLMSALLLPPRRPSTLLVACHGGSASRKRSELPLGLFQPLPGGSSGLAAVFRGSDVHPPLISCVRDGQCRWTP